MFIGNIILAIVNIPLAGLLVRVLAVPPKILYPIVLGLSFVGAYAISNSVMDFYLLIVFGLLGFIMSIAGIPASPLILAVIVGNNMEQSFRRAYKISNGELSIFVKSPISITLIILTLISIFYPIIKAYILSKKKKLKSA
jgi:putative tricarboxylic transport membrane protein